MANKYEYGDCIPAESVIVGTTSVFDGDESTHQAQIGGSFVGNVAVDSKVSTEHTLEQTWITETNSTIAKLVWDNLTSTVKVYGASGIISTIPIPIGSSIGIARVANKLVMTLAGLEAFLIEDNCYTGTISVHFKTNGDILDIRAGYTGIDDFDALKDSLQHTTNIKPENKWNTTVLMDCDTGKTITSTLDTCPISICTEGGTCLQYKVYDTSINVSGLNCELHGVELCKYTIGIVEGAEIGGRHILFIDGSRGYISDPLNSSKLDDVFSEYDHNFGMEFRVVASDVELEAIVDSRKEGVFPDMAILNLTIPAEPRLLLYRSINAIISKMMEVVLRRPTSLGGDQISECKNHIIHTYQDRDIIDSCIVSVMSACNVGCSGWIYSDVDIKSDFKFSFRVQGDIQVVFKEVDDTIWAKVTVDISEHTITIQVLGVDTVVNIPIQVGMLVTICLVGDILSIYIENNPHYRTILALENSVKIHSNPTTTIAGALIDPKLNGKMLNNWKGDTTYEEISNCGVSTEIKTDLIVKDLHPECDTGKLYYREVTGMLNKGSIQRVLSLDTDVYRAYVDIYLENRGTQDVTVSIYMSANTKPFGKDTIASFVVIKPDDTYVRRSQGIVNGSSVYVVVSRDDVHLLIQTIEETYKN